MNITQRRYELAFNMLGNSQKLNTTNYFRTIESIRSRKNQFPASPKKYIIKSSNREPYKDHFVIKANKSLRIKIETLQSKPVIPKINTEYIKIQQRIKNNKEKVREIYKTNLFLQNEQFVNRVFSQKPRIINTKLLEKLYKEKHEKYIKILKIPKRKDSYNSNLKPVMLPRISKSNNHYRTEVNLDSDNEECKDSNNINNSLELKDHEHKDISHQRQGYIEGKHRYDNNAEKTE